MDTFKPNTAFNGKNPDHIKIRQLLIELIAKNQVLDPMEISLKLEESSFCQKGGIQTFQGLYCNIIEKAKELND